MLSNKGVEGLESNVKLSRAVKLAEICDQKLWLLKRLFETGLYSKEEKKAPVRMQVSRSSGTKLIFAKYHFG